MIIFTVTPTKILPAGTTLKITTPKYWPTSSVNSSFNQIISSSAPLSCLAVSNVLSSIQCTVSGASTIYIVTISDILSNSTTQSIQFSLATTINPPTTQPQGSFTIESSQNGNTM